MSNSESVRTRSVMAVALAAVAGFVDAVGYVTLDLFSAHMSGNSARLGVYLGHGTLLRAAPAGFAIALFVLSIAAGTVAMEFATRSRLRSPAALVIGAEMLLLALLVAYSATAARNGQIPRSSTALYYGLASLAVVAMGLQTSTLQRISGQTVRTTYVSGMLTNLAEEIVNYTLGRDGAAAPHTSYLRGELGLEPGRRSLRRIALIALIWSAYAAGAIIGSYLQQLWQLRCLGVPVALLAIVAVVELRSPI